MTTSREPERPRREHRTPLPRRVRYALADGGYKLRKAARRVGDAARNASGSRPRLSLPPWREVEARILAFGEWSSRRILAAVAPLGPPLERLRREVRSGLAWLEAEVTPLRAVVAVTGIAALLLAVSQFVDYRGVAVGADDYAYYGDVEAVAPAPQVDRKPAGSAHAYLLLPVALGAFAALVACMRGRRQLARAVSLLGLTAIAVSLAIDVPAGLDVGGQEVTYASVEAVLVEGFYVQLTSAIVLVAGGVLILRYSRAPEGSRARAGSRAAAMRSLGTGPGTPGEGARAV